MTSQKGSSANRCLPLRDRVISYTLTLHTPSSASEIAHAIGGRGITPGRVTGFIKGHPGIIYIPGKTVKTGPNTGKNVGAGKWMRRPGADPK